MKNVLFLIAAALSLAACKNEAPRDADPCAKAVANARRLAAAQAGAIDQFGAEPLSLDRCRQLTVRAEVQCIGYASNWSELTACSPTALRRN